MSQVPSQQPSFAVDQSEEGSRDPPSNLTEYTDQSSQDSVRAAASLLGAESMVRELNMASPQSGNSPAAEVNEPRTPNDTENPQSHPISSSGNTESQFPPSEEDTPKAPTFTRQFSLPITPSFYYDPYDPSTHNLEYASRVSGHDFSAAQTSNPRDGAVLPLPDTIDPTKDMDPASSDTITEMQGKASSEAVTTAEPSTPADQVGNFDSVSSSGGDDFLRPPHRWGKLTSTTESFAHIILRLDNHKTTWGRHPQNTIVYPHPADVRVAKVALGILFWGPGISEEESRGGDLTKIKGLHTLITTGARGGIWVNGTHLPGQAPDGSYFAGRVYSGDVIRVCHNPLLEFVCELQVGEGAKPRRTDEEGRVPAFTYGREQDLVVH